MAEERVVTNFPICPPYAYQEQVETNSGELISGVPENVYCGKDDVVVNQGGDAFQVILDAFDDPETISRVTVATFSFNSIAFANWLCQRQTDFGFEIEVIEERRADVPGQPGFAHFIFSRAASCSDALNSDQIRISYLGYAAGFISFHPKVILVERGQDAASMVLSTGHIRSGTTVHFDTWMLLKEEEHNKAIEYTRCFLDVVRLRVATDSELAVLKRRFDECTYPHSFLSSRGVEIFFLPFSQEEFRARLLADTLRADSIDIAVPFYSRTSTNVFFEFVLQSLRGASFRLVTDDDIYWAHQRDCPNEQSPESGFLQAECSEFERVILPSINAGAQVRYLQTNHHCAPVNIMHTKLFTFGRKGRGNVSYVGSATLSRAAVGPSERRFTGNVEAIVRLTQSSLVNDVQNDFESLFDLASDWMELPKAESTPLGVFTDCPIGQ